MDKESYYFAARERPLFKLSKSLSSIKFWKHHFFFVRLPENFVPKFPLRWGVWSKSEDVLPELSSEEEAALAEIENYPLYEKGEWFTSDENLVKANLAPGSPLGEAAALGICRIVHSSRFSFWFSVKFLT